MRIAVWPGAAPAAIDRVLSFPAHTLAQQPFAPGEAWIEIGEAEEVSAATHYVAAGPALAARPSPPAPPALTAGAAASWSGLPAGATVRVIDPTLSPPAEIGAGEADGAGALDIEIAVAGPWRLAVDEIWPARGAVFDVIVEPGE